MRTFPRTIARSHGDGWGRKVGDGGRMKCALHGYGCGAGSELRSGLGWPGAPYDALSRSLGRVGFAVVIEGGGAKPWYACDRWQGGAASRLDTTELLRMPVRNEARELLIAETAQPAKTRATLPRFQEHVAHKLLESVHHGVRLVAHLRATGLRRRGRRPAHDVRREYRVGPRERARARKSIRVYPPPGLAHDSATAILSGNPPPFSHLNQTLSE